MKLSNLIILLLIVLMLNGCGTGITGQAVAEPQDYNELKQIEVPKGQYSSNMDFFDAGKIHDSDTSQDAWSANGFAASKYVKIDAGIGKGYAFSIINLYFYNGWYEVQYSDDDSNWVTVTVLFNGRNEPFWTDARWGFQGFHRYWRLLFKSRYWDEDTAGQEMQWWGYEKQ